MCLRALFTSALARFAMVFVLVGASGFGPVQAQNVLMLATVESAADAVICQAGCISHGAYWKLKDHCKRKGKPCVYLKGAGVSSFVRGISEVAEAPVEPS